MGVVTELYYAANGSGQCCVFLGRPVRNEEWRVWEGRMYGFISSTVAWMETFGLNLPPMKWEDEPLKLTLTLTFDEE